ncbi:hypothetical protein GGR57DRAFT_498230 [Xylariaceae sp. FL1272]|nr:hypothetical protein GGR57DRAFT_498230 [Xylariaceae sp. FL1272]
MDGSTTQQSYEKHWQDLKKIRQKEYTDEIDHLTREWKDEVKSKQKEFLLDYEKKWNMAPSEFAGFLTKSSKNFHEAILQPITDNMMRRIRLAGEAHAQGQKDIQFEYSRAISPNASMDNAQLSTVTSTISHQSWLSPGVATGMIPPAPKIKASVPQPGLDPEALPTPTPTVSSSSDEPARPNNLPVKFEDVFKNGQAQHRIVEAFPGEWYILKCDEHKKFFTGERPIQGAAKHLDSLVHDFMRPRNHDRALRLLGYRVIDCDRNMAALNNSLLPDKKSSTKSRPSDIAGPPSATSTRPFLETPGGVALMANGASDSAEESSDEPPPEWINNTDRLITKPKTFHIYWAFWKEDYDDEPKIWPVLILGWDDQTPGGLKGDLVGTGLLDGTRPRCYKFRSNTITGWAKGFEDDGPRITQRKFPVMFFDETQSVAWVSPRDLLPIHMDNPPDKHDHPIQAARRWILKKDGFESWDEFEKVHNLKKAEKRQTPVTRDEVSPVDRAKIAEGTTSSDRASTESQTGYRHPPSSVSEEEIQRLLQTAGEIPGDDDYEDSDEDSTLSIEREEWDGAQNNDRPWAFYGLRDMRNKGSAVQNPENTTPQTQAPSSEALNEDDLSTPLKAAMASARILSASACSKQVEADEPSSGKPLLASPKAPSSEPQLEASFPAMSTFTKKSLVGRPSLSMTSPTLSYRHTLSASDDVSNDRFSSVLRGDSQSQNESRDRWLPAGGNGTEEMRGLKRSWPDGANEADRSPFCQGLRDEQAKKARITPSDSKDSYHADKNDGLKHSNSLFLAESLGTHIKGAPRIAQASTMVEAEKPGRDSSEGMTALAADSIEQTASKTGTEAKHSPVEPAFIPRLPVGSPLFEVAKYEKGSVQWTRKGLGPLVGLYPSFDNEALGTVRGEPVQIVIRPRSFNEISRKQIPGANGNFELRLISDNEEEADMKLIFDRSETNKKFVDPPVIQVRNFRRWLEGVNKNIKTSGG